MKKRSERDPSTESELIANEIEDLERPPLRSVATWCAALAGFGILALIVAAFMFWEATGRDRAVAKREAEYPPTPIALRSVETSLESRPLAFRWDPLAGADSYIVLVRNAESDEVIMIRAVKETYVTATDVESANLVSGRYEWSLEARKPDGTQLGYGEGSFTVD